LRCCNALVRWNSCPPLSSKKKNGDRFPAQQGRVVSCDLFGLAVSFSLYAICTPFLKGLDCITAYLVGAACLTGGKRFSCKAFVKNCCGKAQGRCLAVCGMPKSGCVTNKGSVGSGGPQSEI